MQDKSDLQISIVFLFKYWVYLPLLETESVDVITSVDKLEYCHYCRSRYGYPLRFLRK